MSESRIDPVATPVAEPATLADQAQAMAKAIVDEVAVKQAEYEASQRDYQAAVEAAAKEGTAPPTPPTPPTLADFTSVQVVLMTFGPQRKAIDAFAAGMAALMETLQRQYIDVWNQQMAAGETPALISLAEAVKRHA